MNKVNIEFQIPCDSDGYATFECPLCFLEFKLLASELQNDGILYHELFCPFCGLANSKQNFLSRKVVEHTQALVENYMIEQLNTTFSNMAKKINKSKSIKASFTSTKNKEVKDIREEDTAEEIFQCKLCNKHEKVIYSAGVSKVFCAYCGVDL